MGTKEKLIEFGALIDAEIEKLFEVKDPHFSALLESMHYSATAGGKRIRPFLTLLICEVLGGDIQKALPYACALELIHTYSLIHDDLPAMDNDDLRRGKPTNHKIYGDARAILAGDALQAYAFEVIANNELMSAEENLAAIKLLAKASGAQGMVGGQEIDLNDDIYKSYDILCKMHRLKTGALIQAAALLGVIAAGKREDAAVYEAVNKYSDAIGLTFQIVDDILDHTATFRETGKSQSDIRNGKTTFLTFMTPDEAFDKAVGVTQGGIRAISSFERKKDLQDLARYLLFRNK